LEIGDGCFRRPQLARVCNEAGFTVVQGLHNRENINHGDGTLWPRLSGRRTVLTGQGEGFNNFAWNSFYHFNKLLTLLWYFSKAGQLSQAKNLDRIW